MQALIQHRGKLHVADIDDVQHVTVRDIVGEKDVGHFNGFEARRRKANA
jgi:hypothetical protein